MLAQVSWDQTIGEHLASGAVSFDLVDHDRLPQDAGTYRVRKHTKFSDFKVGG